MNNKRKGGLSKKASENIFVALTLAWPILMFLIFYVYMNFQSIIMAFQNFNYLGKVVDFAGFDNFKKFFNLLSGEGELLGYAVYNSLRYWILCFIISNPLYILFSYVLFKRFKGDKIIRLLVLIPSIISGMIFSLIVKNFVNEVIPRVLGADINLLSGENAFWFLLVYDIWLSFATSLLVYPNVMGKIPTELFESASIDGIDSVFKEIWYIILPGIYPTIQTFVISGVSTILSGSGSLLTFFQYGAPKEAYSFGYFYTVNVMTGSAQSWPILAAGGLVMTAIIAPLVLGVRKLMDKIDPLNG